MVGAPTLTQHYYPDNIAKRLSNEARVFYVFDIHQRRPSKLGFGIIMIGSQRGMPQVPRNDGIWCMTDPRRHLRTHFFREVAEAMPKFFVIGIR